MATENQSRQRQIAEAVQAQEVTDTEAWSALDALSGNTVVDTVETFLEEIRIDGDAFSGPLTWYVLLRYGQGNVDQLNTSESFPGGFEGHFEDGRPVIDRMSVDVSSFYE
ncbi:hypothetical protein [Bosea sp. 685]|uniref:pPIWI-associating nuclease domain-containing protein n=1 Tax=Bosea sp. 685 TaxID=3080057 RepID=UPI002892DF9A|nr:hypothetical protein [Bosea sp. 685]WNJ90922.1 hypothetical protein RMR04_32030 [Bosea sp. 685]